jgi:RNase H
VSRKRLGEREHYVVANTEAVGLVLAACQLEKERDITTVAIYVDNQAVIQGLKNGKSRPGHYILDEFNRRIERLQKEHEEMRVVIRWISGHSRVEGNEEADKEANEAAEGKETQGEELDHIIRRTTEELPRSITAAKMGYKRELKGMWTDTWESSRRSHKLEELGGLTKLRKFVTKTTTMNRH